MKKEIYTDIKDTLLAIEGIRSVKLWNNEIMTGLDTLDRFPLLFLQFAGLDYQTMTGKLQECNDAKITVHILYKTLDGEDTGIFDLSQTVYAAMQAQGFERTNEVPNYSGGEVIDWQITFSAPRFEDDAATVKYLTAPTPTLEISIS